MLELRGEPQQTRLRWTPRIAPATVAVGFRVHCGWAAAVAVVCPPSGPRVVAKEIIDLLTSNDPRAAQVYHAAAELPRAAALAFVRKAEATVRDRAGAELEALLAHLRSEHEVCGIGIVAGNGRAMGTLEEILRSHATIHAAEGEFFRRAIVAACEAIDLPVLPIPSRDLYPIGVAALGEPEAALRDRLTRLGSNLGTPWAADQKEAALVALLALYRNAADRSVRT
jgi:hypothetical protein